MEHELTVAEAARNLVEVVAWVQHQRESTRLIDSGQVVARIIPAEASTQSKTAVKILAAWNDLRRPRLTEEEADSFSADIESGKTTFLPPKESPWD